MCYWTFSQHLRELGTRSNCLQTPTAEMCNTVKASGKKCSQKSISTGFYYEFKQTDLKFVVFKDIITPWQPVCEPTRRETLISKLKIIDEDGNCKPCA